MDEKTQETSRLYYNNVLLKESILKLDSISTGTCIGCGGEGWCLQRMWVIGLANCVWLCNIVGLDKGGFVRFDSILLV